MKDSPDISPALPYRAPAVPLAVAFIVGVAIGLPVPIGIALVVIPIVFSIAMIAAWRGKVFVGTVLALAGFFGLGAASNRTARMAIEQQLLLELFEELSMGALESPTLVEGRLIRESEQSDDNSKLLLEVDRIILRGQPWACRGGLLANVHGDRNYRNELEELHPGDSIRLWAVLRRPRSYENPGRFDLEAYMNRQGVTLTGSVKSALLVERIESGAFAKSLLARVRRYARRRIADVYQRAGLTASEAPGVVLALIIGDRSLIPYWAEQLYQRAGTFHVIAISGAHVGLLALLLYGGSRRLGVDQTPALLALLVSLPVYAALTGGRPSVVRAVLMSSSVVGAKLMSLDRAAINGLALSALVLLAFRPLDLHDPGFQLSFVATASILAFYAPIARALTPKLGRLGTWIAISIAAQIGVIPIVAWHFGRVAPAAVAANIVVMPLAGVLMVSGAVLVIVAPLPWLGEGVAWVTWLCAKGMTVSSQLAVALPGGSFRVASPGRLWIFLFFAFLVLIFFCRGMWRKAMVTGSSILVLWLVFRPSSPTCPSELRLTAFDVGNGDAILLELPGGERVLVDGGGSFTPAFDIGERVVLPALSRLGIRLLDVVVLTHPHGDHIGGLPAVISSLRVKEIWEGKPAWNRRSYRDFRERARARGVPIQQLSSGDRIGLGPVRIEVLFSSYGKVDDNAGGNDDSLVLHFTYGRAGILLTGDAGEKTEMELIRSGALPRVDVLKVGHHGSRSSTIPAFLKAIAPRVAVISTRGSGFVSMPSVRVLARLRRRGVQVFRTDRDGAVTVSLDEEGKLRVKTFRGDQ